MGSEEKGGLRREYAEAECVRMSHYVIAWSDVDLYYEPGTPRVPELLPLAKKAAWGFV